MNKIQTSHNFGTKLFKPNDRGGSTWVSMIEEGDEIKIIHVWLFPINITQHGGKFK